MTKETDRELMELAAKAAGIEVHESDDGTMQRRPVLAMTHYVQGQPYSETRWDPLRDDAQALRLAVKLGIKLELHPAWVYARAVITKYEYLQIEEGWANGFNDPCAATRRAIVRAAAEIGRAMP